MRDKFWALKNYFVMVKLKLFILKKTQMHRDQYGDRSGELHQIKEFVLPIKNEKMNESFLP